MINVGAEHFSLTRFYVLSFVFTDIVLRARVSGGCILLESCPVFVLYFWKNKSVDWFTLRQGRSTHRRHL